MMKLNLILLITAAVTTAMFSCTPSGRQQTDYERPGTRSFYFEDTSSRLTAADVRQASADNKFIRSEGDVYNFGYTRSAYWIRLDQRNPSDSPKEKIVEAGYSLLDEIDLYIFKGDEQIYAKKNGRVIPNTERGLRCRKFAFHITIPPESDVEIYIRAASKDSLAVPLSIWDPEVRSESVQDELILLGIYYGLIAMMVIYNIIIFFGTAERSYIYYSASLIFMNIIFQLGINGLTGRFISDSMIWTRESIPFSFCIGTGFLILFARDFLSLHKGGGTTRILSWVFIACAAACFTNAALVYFIDYFYVIQSTVVIGTISAGTLWAAGFISMLNGNRSARFYMLALSATIFCGITYSLKAFGFIPSNVITEYSWQAGTALQAVLLNFAQADRINILQKERYIAQKNSLEKEKLAREAQEKFSERLEFEVRDRTAELHGAVAELKKRDESIQRELDLAAAIQSGIIPETPYSFNGIKIVSYYKSLEKIGGDFFDFFPVKGDHLCVVIADVSGHGIPAAFVTTIAKIYFTESADRSIFPKEIFRFVNDRLLKTVKTQEYISAFIIVISPSYEVYYANASHQLALKLNRKDSSIEEWDTDGLFLGAIAEADSFYADKSDYLTFGDRILLYTDGIVEARNTEGIEFGTERLKKIFSETSNLGLDETRAALISRIDQFAAGAQSKDDASFLILEIDKRYSDLLSHKNAGLDMLYHRDFQSAVDEFMLAAEIDPNNETLHLLIGKTNYRMRQFEDAALYLKKYLAVNPDDPDAWSMLGASQFNLHEYNDAADSAMKAMQLKNNFIKAMQILGFSLKKLHRIDESRAIWQRILRIDPQNITAAAELETL